MSLLFNPVDNSDDFFLNCCSLGLLLDDDIRVVAFYDFFSIERFVFDYYFFYCC